MSACNLRNSSTGHNLYLFLERKPENYDVTFAVGPEKTLVKALKVILLSSSAVFEKQFEVKWNESVMKEGEGIPLPDLDPDAFKIFIRLMILGAWSFEALKELKLSANQLLNLLSICIKYEMSFAVHNLQKLYHEFLNSFGLFMQTNEFLNLSRLNLERILGNEELSLDEVDIFDCACRWAENQCKAQNLELTGANYRVVLGNALFRIRFPIMTFAEFTKTMKLNNLLTAEETIMAYKYIGLDDAEKIAYAATHRPFTFRRRQMYLTRPPVGCGILNITKLFPFEKSSVFVCNGTMNLNYFAPNQQIAVYGFGFLGPVDRDAFFQVTVEIKKFNRTESNWIHLRGKEEKKVYARKGEIFYFILNQPVGLESIRRDYASNCYGVYFSLKGPHTQALKTITDWKSLQKGDVTFHFAWDCKQMAEIIYKPM